MKIKNIAAICKKNKYAVIYERYTEGGGVVQYIGDGAAAYPVTGLPALDKESLLTIFDVPEKQREDWFVQVAGIPSEISFEDMDANEKPVEREAISIAYSGKTLKPLQTRRGLVFIESRYLSPVSDILDVLELYERITPGGTPYIVAKAGFLLQAVIMPYDVISQQFVDNLKRLTEQCVLFRGRFCFPYHRECPDADRASERRIRPQRKIRYEQANLVHRFYAVAGYQQEPYCNRAGQQLLCLRLSGSSVRLREGTRSLFGRLQEGLREPCGKYQRQERL